MNFARAFHTSVVLPDGTVLIMGGQPFPVPFSDYAGVLAAELWDPVKETFTVLSEVQGQIRLKSAVGDVRPTASVALKT